ncbi:methionine aminopeptidase [Planctopirus ephydatiae]|uniref:Methionine aminopeptidase n=1 Tax=Planctopirus ephydatiae TaxID=2528019 RepID=A0A518GRN6_9PLAN|nr:hypothetical protein [Planctopirus ephydatiae]QDV31268.1 methionine aminopeptidase [Planctopirus ephydatiae]
MTIESEDDVAALKRIGGIVANVLREMLAAAEPGMTTPGATAGLPSSAPATRQQSSQ